MPHELTHFTSEPRSWVITQTDRSSAAAWTLESRAKVGARSSANNPPVAWPDCGSIKFSIKAKSATTRITLGAGIASFVGPAFGVLPYVSNFEIFPNSFLGDVWLRAAIGAISVVFDGFAISRGSEIAGTIRLLTNISVLAYWGFVAFFFATGGSR